MTQAVTSIDSRLIGMLGRKLYSSNPLPIVVRELLQNSVDACIRKGVEPRITITMRQVHADWDDWIVSCDDNGDGMTEHQIVNDFLRLGGKKVDGTGQTGGFGIAKAAILSCDDWNVRSLDNFLNRDILESGGKIGKRKFRDGTKVTVRIRENVFGNDVMKALQMVYYSDVQVRLIARHDKYPRINLDDPKAGLPDTVEQKLLEDSEFFDLWGAIDLELSEFAQEKYGFEAINETGWNIIRLNGLMQMRRGARMSTRQTNLFFDIKTDKEPEDSGYPFSMSREKLEVAYEELVDAFVDSHNANVVQSIAAVVEDVPDEERVEVLPGRLLTGTRGTSYTQHGKSSSVGMGNMTAADIIIEEKMRRLSESNSAPVRLLIRKYKRDPSTKSWHAKLLLAWQDIMQLVADTDEEFGMGITSNAFMEAARWGMDGDIYYLLNPELAVPDELAKQSSEAIVLSLWALACHEATHRYVSDHNEHFTGTMNNIQRDSAEVILRALQKIARRLS